MVSECFPSAGAEADKCFCKGPDSNYFALCTLYRLSAFLVLPLQPGSSQTMVNAWMCCIQYNFIYIKMQFYTFHMSLSITTILIFSPPCKNVKVIPSVQALRSRWSKGFGIASLPTLCRYHTKDFKEV